MSPTTPSNFLLASIRAERASYSSSLQHFLLLCLNRLLIYRNCTLTSFFDFLLQFTSLSSQGFKFIFKFCNVFGNGLRTLKLIE